MRPYTWITLFLLLILHLPTSAQKPDSTHRYRINKWVSGSIGAVGSVTTYVGVRRLLNKDDTAAETILALSKDDVNSFDRVSLRQDVTKRDRARTLSDIGLVTGFVMPGLLLIDKDIRAEWDDVLLLYWETQAIAASMYCWSPLGPSFTNRFRPMAYYGELPLEDRREGRKRNSFFSGHVSTTATGAFFTAKVYVDFHPGLGAKKWLIYGLALVPPAFVGINRIRSLNHFPTDVMMGTLVGAASGVLIPHFHRNKNWNGGLSFFYGPSGKGVTGFWRF